VRDRLLRLAWLVAAVAVPWTTAFGEERYVEALHGWLVVDAHGPAASDAILLDVRWLDGDRQTSTHFPLPVPEAETPG
jgi:hypothetical protein